MKRAFVAVALLLLVIGALWSYQSGGAMHLLLSPHPDGDGRLTAIQDYFKNWGAAAPFSYFILVIVEVVLAPIPGTVLYLPGGAIFGWEAGGAIALSGNVVGAGLACQIMRTLGRDRLARYLEAEHLKRYQAVLEQRGLWIVFLLRLNPLTSSDLVSYAAGLTRVPLWKVMAGTFLGMTPLCFIQAYFSQELFTLFPQLIYPLIALGILYAGYVVLLLRRLALKNQA